MRIKIGSAIAQLRHARGITQEQLAAAIGVSAPAVSKWETGQSYPDITLLAPLARYFETSVDTLLAFRQEMTDAEREAAYERVNAVFDEAGWDAGLAASEALLRAYPTDAMLRILLATGMMRNLIYAGDDAQRADGRARRLAWLQEAEAHADGNLALLTQYQLGMTYLQVRALDEAEAIFEALDGVEIRPRQMMPTLRMLQSRYPEAIRMAQENLLMAIADAVNALMTLTSLAAKDGRPEDATRYAQAGDALLDTLSLKYPHRVTTAQARMIAAQESGDQEALLSAAEQWTQAVLHRGPDIDSPFFDRLDRAEDAADASAYDQALMRAIADDMERSPAYASVRDTPRFQALLQTLRAL